jgi:2,3-dihydroxybenzoate-AMP ligase
VRRLLSGHLVVEGRVKDVINRGGEKVAAEEVENLLLAHPAVRGIALVAMLDPLLGERTCAFAVPSGPLTLADVRAFLRRQGAAEYKLPDRLELVEAFPKTNIAKISKAALRERIRARLDADGKAHDGS